jgi:hypothetical protein
MAIFYCAQLFTIKNRNPLSQPGQAGTKKEIIPIKFTLFHRDEEEWNHLEGVTLIKLEVLFPVTASTGI